MKQIWIAIAVAGLAACSPRHYVKTTADTPVCTSQQMEDWQRAKNDSLGVSGIDLSGHRIGFNPANRTWVGMNWYPFDGYKQTLCGQLHHFNFYDAWNSGDEADWNSFIIPSAPYVSYLEDALSFAESDDVHDCGGRDNCMEAEVTPDESFYNNAFFSKSSDSSPLEGRNLCTYGPWVWEEAHGNRPEIHTSEMYWWRANANGTGDYLLLAVQDDSNRFDRPDDFAGPSTRPAWWHPWSAFPRNNQFRVAFELNPAASPKAYSVQEEYRREIHVSPGSVDADDGKDHGIQYNGKVVLTVQELEPEDGGIGVLFPDLCRNEADNRLQGYVAFTTKFGNGDRGKEGYHVLRVSEGSPVSRPVPSRPAVAAVGGRMVPGSLRRVSVDGKPALVGDVDFVSVGTAQATVSKVELDSKAMELQPGGAGDESKAPAVARVSSVPALGGKTLTVTLGEGKRQPLALPGLTVVPHLTARTQEGAQADAAAIPRVVAAVGGVAQRGVAMPQLQRATSVKFDAMPFYAALRDGEPAKEEGMPFARELNEAIEKDPSRLQALFGVAAPFKIEWTFTAVEAATATAVPVRVGAPTGTDLTAQVSDGRFPGAMAQISFPSGSQVYEVFATAKVTDSYGTVGEQTFRASSHALATADADTVVQQAFALAGASALASSSQLPEGDGPAPSDAQSRRARMVRAFAIRAAQDQWVDVDELRRLVRGTRRAAGQ